MIATALLNRCLDDHESLPVLLAAYSPELNAMDRVGLYLRERLCHRLWPSILAACCGAGNARVDETGASPCAP
jgi:hypothetical protein